jgi:mono/diheme cytochrome c family protein
MIAALVLLVALTPAEKRGRELYFNGGPATAVLAGAAEVPASSVPCASCHGPDRRGVAEGIVVPPDIRWSALSQPDLEKPRPRYDDAALLRAITQGVNSRGDPLSPVMPRYRMSADALSDLIAFLKRDAPDPGLTDTSIAVATSTLARPVVAAFIDDLNKAGGIYGRTLHLADSKEAFALVGASDPALDPLDRVPAIAPFATSATPTSFALYADLTTQALALSRSYEAARNVFIEHDGSPAALAAAASLTPRDSFPRGDEDLLFLLGDVDVDAILARLEREHWRPRILAAGTRRPLPPGRRIARAAPTIPADITPSAHLELATFAERHRLPPAHAATQLATYATLKVFVEALKRAGRDLTRETLIAALEQLYDFPTGLTPPITFHRARRIGAAGAWVVGEEGKARWVRVR